MENKWNEEVNKALREYYNIRRPTIQANNLKIKPPIIQMI
jgi:hypothetical protein